MQQAEVQEVTFSAGLGVGGSVTLTYTDLYGQSWTTRPISLGEGSHYVLDYAISNSITDGVAGDASLDDNIFLNLNYGGVSSETRSTGANSLQGLTAAGIRKTLLDLTKIKDAGRGNLARSVYVTERPHKTSHKFATGIEASTKKTFDIYITQHPTTGLGENGGLLSFTAALGDNTSPPTLSTADIEAGKAFVQLRYMSDASNAIKDALEGLPNSVLPAVTVSKVDVTTANTNDLGANGNAYHQTYRITFSSASNTGDQNMLSCDAEPCDSDGCINRKVGAASVFYVHADPTQTDSSSRKTANINFQGNGYFIMDIHRNINKDPADGDFSSGTAYVEWNTGLGVERAEFPIIADASTVQASLRAISGWSGVTVSSQCAGNSPCENLDKAHSYTVSFPSGYDDGGQTPKVGLVSGYGGNAGGSNNDGAMIIFDQRFSNSIWLGDVTGYHLITCTAGADTVLDFCDTTDDSIQGEIGDKMDISAVQYGHLDATNSLGDNAAPLGSGTPQALVNTFTNVYVSGKDFGLPDDYLQIADAATINVYVKVNHDEDFPLQTSQNTEHYFSVGSTIDVLESTWTDDAPQTREPSTAGVYVTNAFRSFKVLSHVKNTHGQMFAKLDSVPTTDSATKYALKVTSHNSTVTNRKNIDVNGRQKEIQVIQPIASNFLVATGSSDTFRIYINKDKSNVEFTEVLDGDSSPEEIEEAINSFSALSGPVTVTETANEIKVAFSTIDGDVPELYVDVLSGSNAFNVHTLVEGWSFFAGHSARLENVQPGSVINITSREVVTFTFNFGSGSTWSANGELVFSYDGHVGGTAISQDSVDADAVEAAVDSILDNKGAKKVDIASTDATSSAFTDSITIKMPKGMDASKLELFPAKGATATIAKSVARNNNGRSFTVKRVENKAMDLNAWDSTSTTTSLVIMVNDKAPVVEKDELQVKRSAAGTACAAITSTEDVEYRSIDTIAHTAGTSSAYSVSALQGIVITDCTAKVYRTSIVVDSMPDTMDRDVTGASIDMHVYGPTGACSVTEATKGTYESDVCSSRGSCDGGSGLCVCHEGYSGEACETQTVLV